MPTLVLSPRDTSDSRALGLAAEGAGWDVEQLSNWRAPQYLHGREVALYGEPLFAEVIAARLSLALIEAPFDWLVHLPISDLIAFTEGACRRLARVDTGCYGQLGRSTW